MLNYKSSIYKGNLTSVGVKLRVNGMYIRGRQFTHASHLLYEKTGKDYAFLHLLCLGLEIILKSALLAKDYHKYKKYNKEKIRHNLKECLTIYMLEYPDENIDENIIMEITKLNTFYSSFQLRYALISEIFIDPKTVECSLTLKFLLQLIEKLDTELESI